MNITYIQEHIWIFVLLSMWELTWKGIALWQSSQNRQKIWFIVLLLINTVGILPIVYLSFVKPKK